MFKKLTSYIQESRTEFKKVNWPSRQEVTRLTLIVIGFSLGLAVFLGTLDLLFKNVLSKFIFKF